MKKLRDLMLRTEGEEAVENLCAVCEALHKPVFKQLINRNGSCVSALTEFLADNPGAVEVLFDWIEENYTDELDDEDFEDDEDCDGEEDTE